jgi:hypothetical protein
MDCDLLVDIDAALSLSDTQERCKVEQAGVFQLVNIEVGTVSKNGQVFLVNKACFKEKLAGLLADLSFVEGSVATKPGWTKLFECDMYILSHVKHVSVFGK